MAAPWLKAAGKAVAGNLPIFGNMISQAIGARQDRRNIEDQQAHQMEMADYQYSKDLEMWERANKYNEPSQQMARLREAGLNPAMIYGSGGAKTTAATQLPKYQAPRPDYSARRNPLEALGALSMYQDVRLKDQQISIATEEARKRKAEADHAGLYYTARAGALGESHLLKATKRAWMFGNRDAGAKLLGYKWSGDAGPKARAWQVFDQELAANVAATQRSTAAAALSWSQKQYRDLENDWYTGRLIGNWAAKIAQWLPLGKAWKAGRLGNLGKPKIPLYGKYAYPYKWNR